MQEMHSNIYLMQSVQHRETILDTRLNSALFYTYTTAHIGKSGLIFQWGAVHDAPSKYVLSLGWVPLSTHAPTAGALRRAYPAAPEWALPTVCSE